MASYTRFDNNPYRMTVRIRTFLAISLLAIKNVFFIPNEIENQPIR